MTKLKAVTPEHLSTLINECNATLKHDPENEEVRKQRKALLILRSHLQIYSEMDVELIPDFGKVLVDAENKKATDFDAAGLEELGIESLALAEELQKATDLLATGTFLEDDVVEEANEDPVEETESEVVESEVTKEPTAKVEDKPVTEEKELTEEEQLEAEIAKEEAEKAAEAKA